MGDGDHDLELAAAPIDEASAYRLIAELTSDYVYSLVPTAGGGFDLEWVSEGFERVTGYTLPEMQESGGWPILMDVAEQDKAARALAAAVSGTPQRGDYKLITKSGDTAWVRVFLRSVFDEDRAVVRVVGAAQDVTEAKRAKEELEEEQARLIAAFEQAAIGAAVLLPNGRLTEVNQELARMLGYSCDAMIGRQLCDFAVPEDEDLVRDLGPRLTARSEDKERPKERPKVRFRHRDGTQVITRLSASLVWRPSGEPEYVVTQIADITEHQRTLELLQARERLLAHAERLAHVGSWEWDAVRDELIASEEARRMTGLRRDEVPRSFHGFVELVHPDDRDFVVRTVTQAVDAAERFNMFIRILRPNDGGVRTLQVRGAPADSSRSDDTRLFGAVWDVTEQVQAQGELIQEAARSRLLSAIARASNGASAEAALEVALRELCLFTGWDVGHTYLVSRNGDGSVIPSGIWYGADEPRIAPFRSATEGMSFVPPEGLPGQVVATRSVVSAPEIPVAPWFPRREVAAESGLRSAHAFPVVSGDEILAVLEFFSFERSEVDADLEDLMSTVGVQLGRTLERERAARALAESEERFRSLADAAIDSIISADEDGVIWYANPATTRIFGYEPTELVGKLWIELFPERVRAAHLEGRAKFVEDQIRGVIGDTLEHVALRKDGTEFPIEVSLSHHATSRGIVFTGMIRDITERRRVAEELAKRQQQLEEAQLMAGMGSWEWEPATDTLLASPGLLTMLGFPPEAQLRFSDLQKIVDPDDLERLQATSSRVAAAGGGLVFDRFRVTSPDGSRKVIETRAEVEADASGGIGRIIAVDQDVTERKRAERLLECQAEVLQKVATREPLRDVLESIADGIEREADGALCSILLVDGGVLRHGAAPSLPDSYNDEIDGLEIADNVGSCGAAAFTGEEVVTADISRDPRWTDFTELAAAHHLAACWSCPIFSEGDEVIGTFALYYTTPRGPTPLDRHLVDVFSGLAAIAIETDRTDKAAARLEAQYRHAQKMQAVGQLAGGVAHDFNNLLQAILTSAEMLAESSSPVDDYQEHVETVLAGARRGAALVRQLLAFARREPLRPAVLDLNGLIDELTPLIRATLGESIELNIALQRGGAFAEIDPGSFEQVLLNLVSNARDATGPGGAVWIETKVEPRDRSLRSQGLVSVIVRDDGTGMEPEVAARAFEPFFTTKGPGGGSGLGLASVYGAIEAADGEIRIETTPGAGTSVLVQLPASSANEEVDSPSLPPRASGRVGDRATILLAEDEPIVAETLERVLTRHGYDVLTATDGAKALELALSDATPIDLMITDVVMPGLSGPEVVRRLREAGRALRVLYMSGYSEETVLERPPLGEGNPYIAKPFTPDSLVAAVDQLLRSGPHHDPV